MNKHIGKKVLAVPCALALVAALGATSAFAANSDAVKTAASTAVSKAKDFFWRGGQPGKELTDEEKAEMTAKMQERLKQQLADGKITQAQYDEMMKAIENGEMPRVMRGQPGKELTDEEKTEMTAKMQERLKQQMADGKITQAQYDEMMKAIESGEMPRMMRHGFGQGGQRHSKAQAESAE